ALIAANKTGGGDLSLRNAQRRLLEDRAETLLALPERILRPLALRHVFENSFEIEDLPARRFDRPGVFADPDPASILSIGFVFKAVYSAPRLKQAFELF